MTSSMSLLSRHFGSGQQSLYATFIVLMVLRFRRTRGLDRATYRPTYVAGAALAVAGLAAGLAELTSRPWYPLLALQWFALLIIPALLLYGLARRRLARSRVADLVVQVNEATSPAAVEAALRRTMADPELQVLFWSRIATATSTCADSPQLPCQPTDDWLCL
jgi:hypothetical protein